MCFDDRAADRKSHSEPAGLGRVERVEQPVDARCVNPGARVLHGNQNLISVLVRSDQEIAGALIDSGHCLHPVHDKIDENLLDLDSIATNGRKRRAEVLVQRDALVAKLALHEPNRVLDQLIEIQRDQLRVGFSA